MYIFITDLGGSHEIPHKGFTDPRAEQRGEILGGVSKDATEARTASLPPPKEDSYGYGVSSY